MAEPRGRARSRTYSAEDEDFAGEIDSLHNDGKSSPSSTSSSSSSSSSSVPAKPQVSKKTIDIMTRLDNANRLPDQHSDDKNNLSSDDEEAAAERELEEQERKKRLAVSTSSSNGNNSTSHTNTTSTTTGGASATSNGPSGVRPGGGPGPRRKKLEDNDYDVLVKILLLGDSGVGKTSLMLRYSEDKFTPSMTSTAGVDYKSQMLEVDGKKVKCQIWDTAGQQRFHVITHSYYKSAHGIVLVYDVSEPHEESFNNIRYWMENIQKHANPNTKKLLLGNKIDMKGKKIETSRGKALADEYGMKFYEVSAKEGTSVNESFNTLAKEIVSKMLAMGGEGGGNTGSTTADDVKVLKDKKGGEKDNCIIM